MRCPRCGLVNPPEAQCCDCGFDFKNRRHPNDILSEAAERLQRYPIESDARLVNELKRLREVIETKTAYAHMPPAETLRKLVQTGENRGLAALALTAALESHRQAILRGEFSFSEWVSLVFKAPFRCGSWVTLLVLATVVVTLLGAVAGVSLLPAGTYPRIVLAAPGIVAGGSFFLFGGLLIYALRRAKVHML